MSAMRRTRTRTPAAAPAPFTAAREEGRAWWSLLLVAAGIAAYANAPGHPFIFDDLGTIVDNPTIRSIGSSLRGGPFQTATAGRPLVNLSFAVNYALGGVEPWGYQVSNLLLHLACALVLFALLRRVFRYPLAVEWVGNAGHLLAFGVALLWVVHPLNSEVIDYVTQRTEVMSALAVLTTCYAGLRALDDRRPRAWQGLAVAAALAGVLCKESAATAPVLLLVLESAFLRRSPAAVLRERAWFYASLCFSWLVLGGLVVGGPRWRSAGFSSGVSALTYLLNQAPLIVHYLRLTFAPVGLVLDYGRPEPVALSTAVPAGLLVLALLAGTVVAVVRLPLIGAFGLWFFVTLAPTSSIVPIATEVGAERRMYLPLVAVLSVVLLLLWPMLAAARLRRTLLLTGVGVLSAGLVVLTAARNREYASGLHMWGTVVERWPSGRAHHNYGIALKAAGRRAEAIAEYTKAADTLPDAEYALAFELQADGRYEEAVTHYRAFIAATPEDINVPRAYHQIGRSLLALYQPDGALLAFRDALARQPDSVDALAGVGDILMARQQFAQVIPVWQQYLALKPDNPGVLMNLGMALMQVNRDADARGIFQRVTMLTPGDVGAHVNLAYALAGTGRTDEAAREFRTAMSLEQDPAGRAEIEAAAQTLARPK